MADPADEDQNPIAQDDAEPGAQGDQQTPSDSAATRPEGDGEQPEQPGDDSTQARDPLALAQQEPPPAPAPPSPKPPTAAKTPDAAKAAKPTTPPPKQPAESGAAKPGDPPAGQQDGDEALALADLPPEDWQKGVLSHKSKGQYLAQRRVIERQKQELTQARGAKEQLDAVEKLRTDLQLEPEQWVYGAHLTSAINRGDPRAIPALEAHLANLRKRNGVPEAPPAPPQAPPTPPTPPAPPAADVQAILVKLKAAEESVDLDALAAARQELEQALKPTQPPPPAKPEQQPPPRQPAQPAPGGDGDVELTTIGDVLMGLGVVDPVARVRELMQQYPDLRTAQPGQRLRAVLARHSEVEAAKNRQARPPAGQTLSGRGGPVRKAGPTTNDPLKHAIRR